MARIGKRALFGMDSDEEYLAVLKEQTLLMEKAIYYLDCLKAGKNPKMLPVTETSEDKSC